MPTRQSIIQKLKQHHKPNDVLAVTVWTVKDVLNRANSREITLTENEAEEILEQVHLYQDPSVGINWDVIDFVIDKEFRRRP